MVCRLDVSPEAGRAVVRIHGRLAGGAVRELEQLCRDITATGRPVDAVAINAGRGAGGDFTRDTDLRDELNIIDVNVTSTVHLAKRVLPGMVSRGAGRVLFTSSIASTMPGSFQAVYNASKAFVQSFSEAVRNELKDTGVTVTALMPGPTDTDFFRRADMQDTVIARGPKDSPDKVASDGVAAMLDDKSETVGGSVLNRLATLVSGFVPDQLAGRIAGVETKPRE